MHSASDATGERSRDQGLRGQLLLLRGRSGLTQRALAALLGISEHAVQKWEQGEGHPGVARLQDLITVYVQRAVFSAGHEEAEARALWVALQQETGQRTPPFDETWFATVHLPAAVAPAGVEARAVPGVAAAPVALGSEQRAWGESDWGEAPDVAAFQGREMELQTLGRWLGEEHCRVVALLGLGGIGKTALATRLAQDLVPHVERLCWRSVRNAPPPQEWLGMAIAALAPAPPVLPAGLPARLGLLLALLRERRCLLVLDNLETVLEPGAAAPRYRAGYEGYGEALRQLGESRHQSTLLLTSREAPPELGVLARATGPVRTLHLSGLDLVAARTLLADKGLVGADAAWEALVGHYGGSPLALKVVGQSVVELFGGEISPFLAYVTESHGAVFGGIRRLLDDQMARLSPLGRSVLYWLAVEREPMGMARLAADLGPSAGYLRSAHEVYLAAFAPDVLKVGVSGAGRTALRVLEQGAPAALIVGRADDGMAARRLEHHLGLLEGVRERVPLRTKRRLLYPPPEADRLLATLSEALATMAARLPGGWPPDVQRLDPPQALDNIATLGLDALNCEPHAVAGPPTGALSGRVVATAGALLIVEQPQASLWGDTAPLALAPQAHDLRRWLGWRMVRSA